MTKFDLFQLNDLGGIDNEDSGSGLGEIVVSPGNLFQINGHRILCGSFRDEAMMRMLMDGQKARLLNTDPPYNITMNLITKQEMDDLAEGEGKMSEEFVIFLSLVMRRAMEHSLPGAMHYIFMDC